MQSSFVIPKQLFLGFCILFLGSPGNRLNAQIVYTDIIDATPNVTYPLDLNNDDIVDFTIQFGNTAGNVGLICYPQNDNAYSGNFVNDIYMPWALSSEDFICDSLPTWYGADYPGTMASGSNIGNWVNASDKYLALKLIIGTEPHYGWARFDLASNSGSFTIKDYAFENTPNTCIQAGQTTLNVNEIADVNYCSIFPNPFNSVATIETQTKLNNASLKVFNIYGQTIKQIDNISGQSINLTRDWLPSGQYIVQFSESNKIIAFEKFIIID